MTKPLTDFMRSTTNTPWFSSIASGVRVGIAVQHQVRRDDRLAGRREFALLSMT